MMAEYIDRNALLNKRHGCDKDCSKCDFFTDGDSWCQGELFAVDVLQAPTADVVEEENILKFYYVRSIDEYWIGRRIDNFYYAEYDPESRQWTWTHSRYLPWGEHIVSPTSLWKEYTYPSEPEEIPFEEWLQGFVKKHSADVVERKTGKWVKISPAGIYECSQCGQNVMTSDIEAYKFCHGCGAKMIGGDEDV